MRRVSSLKLTLSPQWMQRSPPWHATRRPGRQRPTETGPDRLDSVFASLNGRWIIALQNAGYTQSDGYDDVRQSYHERSDRDRVIGYCFYHGQDLERAVHGEGLYLAFGPMDAKKEKTEGPRIGAMIVEELTRAGFAVRWDGTFDQRISIPAIDWKRR